LGENHRNAMKRPHRLLGIVPAAALVVVLAASVHAQVAPTGNPEQLAMLNSTDAHLAKNKRLVFDFWRIVYEGGHLDQAPKYMAETYIQHNPNVKSGRAAFVELFSRQRPPKPVAPLIKVPVISIVAEHDLVSVFWARKVRDRQSPEHIYYMTWFDMFRIDDHGLIAEHWDPSEMWVDGKPPGAEFFP
jgi:predicted SnoaL-like aldol condensation-catalyzing enzyme